MGVFKDLILADKLNPKYKDDDNTKYNPNKILLLL